jgi:hypothetical protein
MKKLLLLPVLLCLTSAKPINYSYQLALLKYNGGGDWYANPTALTNLARFANKHLKANINPDYATVEVGSSELFNYPFLHMTGHGNVVFNQKERLNLRQYLLAGGFLHIDDNYGMDKFIRPELKKVFPAKNLEPLPANHPIFNQTYRFPKGLPKIHEHDKKPPQGYVFRHKGRIILLYTHECDLSDGWEDAKVHNDAPEIRLKALQMGANILQYINTGQND